MMDRGRGDGGVKGLREDEGKLARLEPAKKLLERAQDGPGERQADKPVSILSRQRGVKIRGGRRKKNKKNKKTFISLLSCLPD